MAKSYKLGLINFLLGAIAADGDMGGDLTPVGDTVTDSATLTTTEASITDFKIEESDSPIMSIKTEADKMTIAWATNNTNTDALIRFFGGTKSEKVLTEVSAVGNMGVLVGGAGYVNGTYKNIPLTGGAGTGARGTVTVAGGVVTGVVKTNGGRDYVVGDDLSADAIHLGGVGAGFSINVDTLVASEELPEFWNAPDQIPPVELSMEGQWQEGGKMLAPRVKLTAALDLSFKRSALSKINLTATILQPKKEGVPRLRIANA